MQTQLGRIIQKARAEHGLSVRRLADLAHVNYKVINRIEKGRTQRPHVTTLASLAGPLGLDLDELLRVLEDGQVAS